MTQQFLMYKEDQFIEFIAFYIIYASKRDIHSIIELYYIIERQVLLGLYF